MLRNVDVIWGGIFRLAGPELYLVLCTTFTISWLTMALASLHSTRARRIYAGGARLVLLVGTKFVCKLASIVTLALWPSAPVSSYCKWYLPIEGVVLLWQALVAPVGASGQACIAAADAACHFLCCWLLSDRWPYRSVSMGVLLSSNLMLAYLSLLVAQRVELVDRRSYATVLRTAAQEAEPADAVELEEVDEDPRPRRLPEQTAAEEEQEEQQQQEGWEAGAGPLKGAAAADAQEGHGEGLAPRESCGQAILNAAELLAIDESAAAGDYTAALGSSSLIPARMTSGLEWGSTPMGTEGQPAAAALSVHAASQEHAPLLPSPLPTLVSPPLVSPPLVSPPLTIPPRNVQHRRLLSEDGRAAPAGAGGSSDSCAAAAVVFATCSDAGEAAAAADPGRGRAKGCGAGVSEVSSPAAASICRTLSRALPSFSTLSTRSVSGAVSAITTIDRERGDRAFQYSSLDASRLPSCTASHVGGVGGRTAADAAAVSPRRTPHASAASEAPMAATDSWAPAPAPVLTATHCRRLVVPTAAIAACTDAAPSASNPGGPSGHLGACCSKRPHAAPSTAASGGLSAPSSGLQLEGPSLCSFQWADGGHSGSGYDALMGGKASSSHFGSAVVEEALDGGPNSAPAGQQGLAPAGGRSGGSAAAIAALAAASADGPLFVSADAVMNPRQLALQNVLSRIARQALSSDDVPVPPDLDVPLEPDDAAVPDAAVPDAAVPDAAVPDAAVPDAAVPDAAVPDAAVPDAAVSPRTLIAPGWQTQQAACANGAPTSEASAAPVLQASPPPQPPVASEERTSPLAKHFALARALAARGGANAIYDSPALVHTRCCIKVSGISPEDVAPGLASRVGAVLAAGLRSGGAAGGGPVAAVGVYVREGCVEIVADVLIPTGVVEAEAMIAALAAAEASVQRGSDRHRGGGRYLRDGDGSCVSAIAAAAAAAAAQQPAAVAAAAAAEQRCGAEAMLSFLERSVLPALGGELALPDGTHHVALQAADGAVKHVSLRAAAGSLSPLPAPPAPVAAALPPAIICISPCCVSLSPLVADAGLQHAGDAPTLTLTVVLADGWDVGTSIPAQPPLPHVLARHRGRCLPTQVRPAPSPIPGCAAVSVSISLAGVRPGLLFLETAAPGGDGLSLPWPVLVVGDARVATEVLQLQQQLFAAAPLRALHAAAVAGTAAAAAAAAAQHQSHLDGGALAMLLDLGVWFELVSAPDAALLAAGAVGGSKAHGPGRDCPAAPPAPPPPTATQPTAADQGDGTWGDSDEEEAPHKPAAAAAGGGVGEPGDGVGDGVEAQLALLRALQPEQPLLEGSLDCAAEYEALSRAGAALQAAASGLGMRLLRFGVSRGWPAAGTLILKGLMSHCRLAFPDVLALFTGGGQAQAQQPQLPLLHSAVASGRLLAVRTVMSWATRYRCPLRWDEPAAAAGGLTPLHLAAVLEDGGRMAGALLGLWPEAEALWATVRDADGRTPHEYAVMRAISDGAAAAASPSAPLQWQESSDLSTAASAAAAATAGEPPLASTSASSPPSGEAGCASTASTAAAVAAVAALPYAHSARAPARPLPASGVSPWQHHHPSAVHAGSPGSRAGVGAASAAEPGMLLASREEPASGGSSMGIGSGVQILFQASAGRFDRTSDCGSMSGGPDSQWSHSTNVTGHTHYNQHPGAGGLYPQSPPPQRRLHRVLHEPELCRQLHGGTSAGDDGVPQPLGAAAHPHHSVSAQQQAQARLLMRQQSQDIRFPSDYRLLSRVVAGGSNLGPASIESASVRRMVPATEVDVAAMAAGAAGTAPELRGVAGRLGSHATELWRDPNAPVRVAVALARPTQRAGLRRGSSEGRSPVASGRRFGYADDYAPVCHPSVTARTAALTRALEEPLAVSERLTQPKTAVRAKPPAAEAPMLLSAGVGVDGAHITTEAAPPAIPTAIPTAVPSGADVDVKERHYAGGALAGAEAASAALLTLKQARAQAPGLPLTDAEPSPKATPVAAVSTSGDAPGPAAAPLPAGVHQGPAPMGTTCVGSSRPPLGGLLLATEAAGPMGRFQVIALVLVVALVMPLLLAPVWRTFS
ncbi:hypothetical protein GPECTOR_4g949 [Gonium pectorale]|uniref:Uncharacterized protein n=1 Tax=Gonium pectorale TaxID=33097 RepID=A0A150GYA1_GONPE|nr:hypothetical protein GPECTOR_4g949 [Gonium pectorale]|eukprot:KXZ54877.1 hypothetical protein GPECTOR_4g949 [Gonium pectorale]